VKLRARPAGALFEKLPLGLALRLLALFLAKRLLGIPATLSFSQTGEDCILSFYFPERTGFYVDVGCNDPLRLSNSFLFYLRGWRGIAIDANVIVADRFQRTRKKDVCIAAAVSDSERDVIFHRSESEAVSTIDEGTLEEWKDKWKFRPEDQVAVRTRTLTSILRQALPDENAEIDFLSIDVEGHEFQVLSSLDFKSLRPKLITVEIHDLKTISTNNVYVLLTANGYSLIGYVTMNAYFIDESAGLRTGV